VLTRNTRLRRLIRAPTYNFLFQFVRNTYCTLIHLRIIISNSYITGFNRSTCKPISNSLYLFSLDKRRNSVLLGSDSNRNKPAYCNNPSIQGFPGNFTALTYLSYNIPDKPTISLDNQTAGLYPLVCEYDNTVFRRIPSRLLVIV